MIQNVSGEAVFRDPRIAFQAAAVLSRADAMGLIQPERKIEKLDFSTMRLLLNSVRRAGIGKTIHLLVSGDVAQSAAEMEAMLVRLNRALEESPAPGFEWERVSGILGADLLARLLGISPISLRRYRTKERPTPDDVAQRLHALAMICGDLAGAYNDLGIRQWFDRKRAQLGGRAPSQILCGAWNAKDSAPAQVRELARALTGSPAT
jgi:hypothetical protein